MACRFERLLVGLLVLALSGLAGAQSQPALRAYAILGVDAVRLGANVRVQPGAVGATTGNVRLAGRRAVPGTVVARSVRVARRVRVGRLFCRASRAARSVPAWSAARPWAARRVRADASS